MPVVAEKYKGFEFHAHNTRRPYKCSCLGYCTMFELISHQPLPNSFQIWVMIFHIHIIRFDIAHLLHCCSWCFSINRRVSIVCNRPPTNFNTEILVQLLQRVPIATVRSNGKCIIENGLPTNSASNSSRCCNNILWKPVQILLHCCNA